jgi:TPP-dependent pyruvate/acetoin dehydrogenase alpha subunit
MAVLSLADAEAKLLALGPRPFPLPLGGMAIVVEGVFGGASRSDWMVCGPRERIGAVLRGCSVERLVDPARGARPYKLTPCSEAPGSRALHAVGLALSGNGPVICMLGTASTATGSFYEALNSAVLTGARVVFVTTIQALPDDAPVARQIATTPAAIAQALGIKTLSPDATVKAISSAVKTARKNTGPTLVQITL